MKHLAMMLLVMVGLSGCTAFEMTVGGLVRVKTDVELIGVPDFWTVDDPLPPVRPVSVSTTNLVVSEEVK